jgi:hypothetical protein
MKQDSFIQTQYFIPVEIDMSIVPARLGIFDKTDRHSITEILLKVVIPLCFDPLLLKKSK